MEPVHVIKKLSASSFLLLVFCQVQYLNAQAIGNGEIDPCGQDMNGPRDIPGMKLLWHDEFNEEGKPDSANWGYEYGFVRNMELQWYQPQNACCRDGLLIIEGKKEKMGNPDYNPQSRDWRSNRPFAEYTSACLITRGLHEWTGPGYYEIRARIDTSSGSWPAIWLLGTSGRWPFCGEIDIMEFYRRNREKILLANVAWGSEKRFAAAWDSEIRPLSDFMKTDPDWSNKFHIFSMTWQNDSIKLFIDDHLMNEIPLDKTVNPDGTNPFTHGNTFYLLINLALGANGGDPSMAMFPVTFEIDYVRVYRFE
ncbi:MAG: glycoside hydrolase family 16 protein [Bacteroidales bacterium]|nr:glycoside hydrolase family 16 protein [Bacteroidales bacterium]